MPPIPTTNSDAHNGMSDIDHPEHSSTSSTEWWEPLSPQIQSPIEFSVHPQNYDIAWVGERIHYPQKENWYGSLEPGSTNLRARNNTTSHKKRRHQCGSCDATFIKKSSLKDHIKTHDPHRKTVLCPKTNCSRKYGRVADLTRHINSVSQAVLRATDLGNTDREMTVSQQRAVSM